MDCTQNATAESGMTPKGPCVQFSWPALRFWEQVEYFKSIRQTHISFFPLLIPGLVANNFVQLCPCHDILPEAQPMRDNHHELQILKLELELTLLFITKLALDSYSNKSLTQSFLKLNGTSPG